MNPWLKRTLAVVLSALLLGWFIRGAHWQGLAGILAGVDWLSLSLASAAFALTYALRAGRIWDEFRRSNQQANRPLPYGGVLRLTLIHNAMVNILPFRSGEAAFPLLLARWYGVPAARAIAALLWLRIQDAFVVLALAALMWPDLHPGLRAAWMLAIAVLAWAIPAWARRHREILDTQGRFARLAAKLRGALAESTRGGSRSWLWTIANWSLKLAAQAWLLSIVLKTSLLTGAAGAMGVELAAILPIQGVAGFGTYEAGGAAALASHGIMLANGLQAALFLHLFVIACALSGGALAAIWASLVAKPHAPTQRSRT